MNFRDDNHMLSTTETSKMNPLFEKRMRKNTPKRMKHRRLVVACEKTIDQWAVCKTQGRDASHAIEHFRKSSLKTKLFITVMELWLEFLESRIKLYRGRCL